MGPLQGVSELSVSPSVFEHVLPFWHHRLFQVHQEHSVPQPWNQPFLQKAFSFWWRMEFRNHDLDTRCAHGCWDSGFWAPLADRAKKHTDTSVSISILKNEFVAVLQLQSSFIALTPAFLPSTSDTPRTSECLSCGQAQGHYPQDPCPWPGCPALSCPTTCLLPPSLPAWAGSLAPAERNGKEERK